MENDIKESNDVCEYSEVTTNIEMLQCFIYSCLDSW